MSKRLTDGNVLLINATQKEVVEQVVSKHKGSREKGARELNERANKYLRVLWASQQFTNPAKREEPPHPKGAVKEREELKSRSRSHSKRKVKNQLSNDRCIALKSKGTRERLTTETPKQHKSKGK